ncbi:MAG: hypothetical protein M9939_00885 [Mesorhizobium sp.]|nr:hypothetical protein [Mesorhizobium sp.]MCO5159663.1 hypothetical protein [Mesorhizobium sp.]
MNAPFRTTTSDLANALSGRAPQVVHIVKTTFSSSPLSPRYVVSVNGEFYECYAFTLRALQNGFTPEELELEVYRDDDEQDDDFFMNTGVYPRASGWRLAK